MISVNNTKREFLELLENLDIKSVLDLGCGKAIMSKFFAERGAKVKGIDRIKECKNFDNFKFVEGNILDTDFGEDNDLVIISLFLHLFKKEVALRIIEKMKESTSKEGYNLLICMSNKDNLAKKRLENFYPTIQELEDIYSNWKVIKKLIDTTEVEEHDGQGPHQHHLIFLLVQNK